MDNNSIFNKERKGYSCKEVDDFLLAQNTRHEAELSERDAEIKRLFSENEDLKSRLSSMKKDVDKISSDLSELKKSGIAETDRVNARIGAKLSAAEEASNEMLKKAEAECEEMKRNCCLQIEAELAETRKKAEEYCARAKRATDIYLEKQQLIASGLEQARRHLDDAVQSIDEILSEKS